MEEKLVSVITPCFNGEDFLDRFFNNILEQTYKNIELIFINDGSNDRTEQIALFYKPLIEASKHSFIYIYQENAGQAAAVNKGIKVFSGDYLMWHDADDILCENNIKRKVEFMEEHPQFGIAQCYGKEVHEQDLSKKLRDFGRIPPSGKDNLFEDLIMKKNVEYSPGLFIVRSSAFLTVNPQRDIFESRRGQNMQMLLPVVYNFPCGYIREDLFTYVIREQSHSHGRITMEELIKRSGERRIMLMETLKRIDMKDREYFTDRVEEMLLREQFDVAYGLKDKDTIKTKYKELIEKKYATSRDALIYYSSRLAAANLLLKSLKSIRSGVKYLIKDEKKHSLLKINRFLGGRRTE